MQYARSEAAFKAQLSGTEHILLALIKERSGKRGTSLANLGVDPVDQEIPFTSYASASLETASNEAEGG